MASCDGRIRSGLLYSAFTYFTGFKVNSGEYKVMGLAPYGRAGLRRRHLPRADRPARRRIVPSEPEVFRLSQRVEDDERRFDELFGGPPREPETPLTQRELDLARSIQDVCEEIMLRMARTAHRETGLDKLCLAGGVALNCVGNGRILREGPFKEIWIQPAAGDAGGALGVAQLIWHRECQEASQPERLRPDARGVISGPCFSERRSKRIL
jgi:carbamoyltransferase